MRPAGDHVHRFDLVTGHLKLHHLAGVDVPLLDEAVTVHHDELLPLAVVPVLPLGDARPTDIDGHLPAVLRVHQLREAAAVVHVHLQRVLELVCRKIGQVQREQFLGERAFRHLRHQECSWLGFELLQQIDDFAQRDLVGGGHVAVASVFCGDGIEAVVLTVLFLTFQQVEHALDEVVDVEQLQLRGAVVDREGLVVRHRPAEGGHGRIVLRAAVTHEVREAVDCHFHSVLFAILEEQLFPRQFRFAIVALTIPPDERRLNGRGEHDGRFVPVLLQRVQQRESETKVALHELLVVLRTVHAREVEHEVAVRAVGVQLLRGAVEVVAVDVVDVDIRARAILAVADVFEVVHEGRANHALCAGDEDVHYFPASQFASASLT